MKSPAGVYRVAFHAFLDAGLRSADLTHLMWDDIDFDHNVIHICEKTWKEEGEIKRRCPKTGDQRVVPMSSAVISALKQHDRKNEWVFFATVSRKYPEGNHQLSSSRLLKVLKRILNNLSLARHVHTFRHTFISHALMQGVPETIVRSWVGHVEDDEIIRRFTHCRPCEPAADENAISIS